MLNGGALVVELLLRRRQLREVLVGDVHLDSAIDLLLARVLLDALNLERRLLRRLLGRRHLLLLRVLTESRKIYGKPDFEMKVAARRAYAYTYGNELPPRHKL